MQNRRDPETYRSFIEDVPPPTEKYPQREHEPSADEILFDGIKVGMRRAKKRNSEALRNLFLGQAEDLLRRLREEIERLSTDAEKNPHKRKKADALEALNAELKEFLAEHKGEVAGK